MPIVLCTEARGCDEKAGHAITAVPAPDDHGKVTITVTVSGGVLVSVEAYLLTVTVD